MNRIFIFLLLLEGAAARVPLKPKAEPSPLDRYLEAARGRAGAPPEGGAGSLWSDNAAFNNLARDPRARHVDDLVTILVAERATASSKGDTKTSRKSDASGGIPRLFGPTASRISNLAQLNGQSQMQGQGATTRESVMTTTLTARVSEVLPNGYLVVEGSKDTMINSERQQIVVRGVVRPTDLSPANQVRSDHIAQLEVRINGKGVVNDSIRRPNILYRLLLGLLPF